MSEVVLLPGFSATTALVQRVEQKVYKPQIRV